MKSFRVLSLLASVALMSLGWSATQVGSIVLSKGQVLILDKDSKVVADPEGKRGRKTLTGSPFFEGETVQTGADGRVKLSFIQGGNEVVLGGSTSLFIEKATPVAQGAGSTSLSLARGEIRSDVRKKYSGEDGDKYEVKTKNAVAGVRGTIFVAKFDPKANAAVFATTKGLVSVSAPPLPTRPGQTAPPPPAPVLVAAGTFTSSVGSAAPIPARPISSNSELSKSIQQLEGGSTNDSASSESAPATGGGETATAKNDAPAAGGSAAPATESSAAAATDTPKSESSSTTSTASTSTSTSTESGGDVPLGREPAKPAASEGGRAPASTSASAAPPQVMGETARPRSPVVTAPSFSAIQNTTTDLINQVNKTRSTEAAKSATGNVTIKIE